MARCGCDGSAGCACVIQAGDTGSIDMSLSGAGSVGSPYVVAGDAKIDPVAGNLLSLAAGGLRVDCVAVAACAAAQTPSGYTQVVDSPGIDFGISGNGTPGLPYQVTGDLKAVFQELAPADFSHSIVTADNVWGQITPAGQLVVAVAGTYLVDYAVRGSITITGSTSAIAGQTVAGLYKNGALVANTERLVALISQGLAGTAQPALQMQGTGSCAKVLALAAGDILQLWTKRTSAAGNTNTIECNNGGRTNLAIHRIGV